MKREFKEAPYSLVQLHRINRDQTLPARITRGMFVGSYKLCKVFNFKNNYSCRYFRVSTDKKTVVLLTIVCASKFK